MTTVTSRNTEIDYDLEDLAKSFGTIDHAGKTLYLLNQAGADNYGTEGLVRYYAKAIDADGIEYNVAWDTTDDWDLACELDRLLAETHPDDDDDDLLTRIEELDDMALPDVSDESNACDWSDPVSVQVV